MRARAQGQGASVHCAEVTLVLLLQFQLRAPRFFCTRPLIAPARLAFCSHQTRLLRTRIVSLASANSEPLGNHSTRQVSTTTTTIMQASLLRAIGLVHDPAIAQKTSQPWLHQRIGKRSSRPTSFPHLSMRYADLWWMKQWH
jgi:hypothetical protein